MLWSQNKLSSRLAMAVLLCFAIALPSCSKQQGSEGQSEGAPKTFASPEEAGKAMIEAVKAGNRDAVLAIFGSESKDVIYSGDAERDKANFAGFVSDYDAMHRWRKLENGNELLITGTDNKVFPIPLARNGAGQWYFDSKAGKDEILARRVGKDEIAAIDICAAIADAQQEYFSQHHDGASQYAQKFISDSGKQNGLYWTSPEGTPRSPLGPLVAYATEEGYKVQPNRHQPYYGYYFVMLEKQGPNAKGGAKSYVTNGKMSGGFGVVAYPAQYGDSGIMTFIINQDGVVFQKDLGPSTAQVAAATTEFDPDQSWKPVEQ
jgi:hypothetical protein